LVYICMYHPTAVVKWVGSKRPENAPRDTNSCDMKTQVRFAILFITCVHGLQAQCPALASIEGDAAPSLCISPSNFPYEIPNSVDADLVWTLNPPIGTFSGSPMGANTYINFNTPGTTQLCATPSNPCYDPTPICLELDVQPMPYVNNPGNMVVCHGDPVYYEFTGDAIYYAWGVQAGFDIGQPPINHPNGIYGNIDFIAKNLGNAPITCLMSANAHHAVYCYGIPVLWNITIYPGPTVNPPNDITVCGGSPVSVAFTGFNTTAYTWTNDNPAIGLAASGTGNIVFTTIKAPQTETATITITPKSTNCSGEPVTFTITVSGSSVDDPADITVCHGEAVDISFLGNASEYLWTNSNINIGLEDPAGSGPIAFTAQGAAIQQQTSILTVTPQPCPFAVQTFNITVLPRAEVFPLPDTTVCARDSLSLQITGTPGTTYSWTNSNPAIGLDTAGNLPFIRFRALQVDSTIKGVITVRPTRQGCEGEPVSFVITIEKCCVTSAGTLDTSSIMVCGSDKIISLPLPGNHTLGPNDTLLFILYSNPGNPVGSILGYSDTLLFPFLPGVTAYDSTYYIAAIAGKLLPIDSINTADPCFSIVKGPKVTWRSKPTITLVPGDQAVCNDGCVDVAFQFMGTPPFAFTWLIEQGGQVLYTRSETANGHQLTLQVCPADFSVPAVGGFTNFRVNAIADRYCGCVD